jgi:hypothetical protein
VAMQIFVDHGGAGAIGFALKISPFVIGSIFLCLLWHF